MSGVERPVSTCGLCGVAVEPNEAETVLVAPAESLPPVLARIRDDRDGLSHIAIRARAALMAGGGLCRYCHTRLESGRAIAELWERGVEA